MGARWKLWVPVQSCQPAAWQHSIKFQNTVTFITTATEYSISQLLDNSWGSQVKNQSDFKNAKPNTCIPKAYVLGWSTTHSVLNYCLPEPPVTWFSFEKCYIYIICGVFFSMPLNYVTLLSVKHKTWLPCTTTLIVLITWLSMLYVLVHKASSSGTHIN
jgi:hypothetical protein